MNDERIYLSQPHMGGREQYYIKKAFAQNWIAPLGDNVNQFEHKVRNYVGRNAAVAVSSGTAAIHLALIECGVKQNDFVFCPSLTFCATCNPILYLNAKPVFIDSEIETWNMCPQALQKAFHQYERQGLKPKAVIVVNLYGQPAKYNEILDVCDYYDVPIIEDAAESLGSIYSNRHSGNIGDFSILSFNGNKIITTSGGGMLLSNNEHAIAHALYLATQAKEDVLYYQHSEMGYNYRLSNISAGIGIGQMEVIDERVAQRRRIFQRYQQELQCISAVTFQEEIATTVSNRWLTALLIDPRQSNVTVKMLLQMFEKHNIEARHVWKPMHLQPLFKNFDFVSLEQDNAGYIFEHGICLPSASNMSILQQDRVINILQDTLLRHQL